MGGMALGIGLVGTAVGGTVGITPITSGLSDASGWEVAFLRFKNIPIKESPEYFTNVTKFESARNFW